MVLEIIQLVATGETTGIRLTRFFAAMIIGAIVTRAAVMPLARRLISRRIKNVTTQASLENLTGLMSGIVFVSISLEVAGYGGLVTILGTVTAALTVAIGFGMREEVGSLVSGVFIQLDRPFIKGDYIEIGDTRGVVDEIKLRSTVLENVESEKVVVPNRVLTGGAMKNFTKGRKTRTSVEIKVPVKHAEKAMEILRDSVATIEEVIEKPQPSVWIEKIEDEKAVLQLECFVNTSRKVDKTRSKILEEFSGRKATEKIYQKDEK